MGLRNKLIDWLKRMDDLFATKFGRSFSSYLVNDRKYAQKRFLRTFGYALNLQEPRTFNEKIQWLKLYYRHPLMIRLADKYLVRDYVREKVGSRFLTGELGTYANVEKLCKDLPNLPDQFALKATHGSGWNIIVENKASLFESEIRRMEAWLSANYFWEGREWCYRKVKPRILCEEFIRPVDPSLGLLDYKFFCFHGEPRYVVVDIDRFTDHRRNVYDISWKKLPLEITSIYKQSDKKIHAPRYFDLMIKVARKLSQEFPFMRVDLYSEAKIYFGELTFYPGNGFEQFFPEKYDREFGDLLDLSLVRQQ